ncbi:MAG: glycoside hydrolase family 3 C-terminal domain-containing protein, partial [Planctomycetota bacterium]
FPEHWVSLVEGMRAECGDAVEIVVAQGCSNQVDAQPLVADVRRADGEPGYDAAFHAGSDPQGEPAFTRTVDEAGVGFFNPAHNDLPETWCAVFSATWKPRYTGRWKFILGARGGNRLRLLLDGQEVAALTVTDDGVRQSFLAKQAVHVEVGPGEHRLALAVHGGTHASLMADYDPEPAGDGRLEEAVALARQADAVVLALGNPCHYESEGSDRPDLRLPGRQDELAEAVLAARPDAAVLLTSGAPLELPWVDRARAILLAHLPGQAGGRASARVLLGRVNPGGRLPHTWPRRIQDTPAITGSGYKRVVYGETVWVGHRWYDARAIEPLFPFGHGLSYTTFAWSDLQLRERIDPAQDTELRLAIRNTGGRDGDEIVQCYIEPPPDERLPRPLRQLAGFSRVPVAAGEMVTATVRIPWRAWRIWDPDAGGWTIPTGEYGIVLGASSRDLRLRTTITIDSVTQDQAGGFTAADAHLQA